MTKIKTVIFIIVIVFSLSACRASRADIKKANEFLKGLSSFSAASITDQIDELVSLSASVIELPDKALNFKKDWYMKNQQHEKYLYIFDSDGTLTVNTSSGEIVKVSYTFCVKTIKDMYNTAEDLIEIYGEPLSVYLNSAPSSHSEVERATDSTENPDLTFSYIWETELGGKDVYVYEAYYYANGIHFSYVVVSNFLELNGTAENKWWN